MVKNIHFTFKRYEGVWKDGLKMVKEHSLGNMEQCMLGNSRMMKYGTEQHTTTTKTSI
jgi:hypothetical protein